MWDLLVKNILLVLMIVPLVGSVILLCLPKKISEILKSWALIVMIVEAIIAVLPCVYFTNTGVVDQFLIDIPWITTWNIHCFVGLDIIGLFFVLATVVIMPLILLAQWSQLGKNAGTFLAVFLIFESCLVGMFCALDLFFFYCLGEIALLALCALMGIESANHKKIPLSFMVLSVLGSAVLLMGMGVLYAKAGTLNLLELYNYRLSFVVQLWVFGAFALSFFAKTALFPLHTILCDLSQNSSARPITHTILSGLYLNIGFYAFLRFCIPLFPDSIQYLQPWLLRYALTGMIFISLVALVQTDIKKSLCYANVYLIVVSLLGLFSLQQTTITGAIVQTLSRTICITGAVLLVNKLYQSPLRALLFGCMLLGCMGFPFTSGFVGNITIFTGLLHTQWILGIIAIVSTLLFVLAVFKMGFLARSLNNGITENREPLDFKEYVAVGVLMIVILGAGIFPSFIVKKLDLATETILLKLDDERDVIH